MMRTDLIVEFIIKRAWWVLLWSVVLLLGFAKGLGGLTFSNDYRDYFSAENPQLMEWERLQQVFTKTDNVLISVSTKQGDLFTTAHLEVIKSITEASWFVPYANRVDSITNYQHVQSQGKDDIIVSDLVLEPGLMSHDELQKVKEIVTTEPLLVHRLMNEEGTTTAINIEVRLSDKPREEIAEIANAAYQLKQRYSQEHPDLLFHITGSVPYNFAMTNATKQDMASLMPAMYLLILVLFVLFTRSIMATFAVFILMVFSMIATMGASAWMGVVLMAPSMSAPTIVMTMAVANAVHLSMSFFSFYRGDIDKKEAIRQTLKSNWSPVLITNLTTAIGFLSMNMSDVPPYRDLGNMVAGGLILVVFFSLFLFPALLRLLPLRAKPQKQIQNTIYARCAYLVVSKYKQISILFITISLLSSFGIMKLELNDRFIEWMDARYEFRNDSDFINTHLTGLYRLDWGLDAGQEGGVTTPEYLAQLDELTSWARSQPGVVHVHSMSDVIKELNQKFHGGDEAYYKVPESQALAAQLLLIYELSLPMGLDLNNMLNVSKSSTHFVIRTANLSTIELLALEQATNLWIAHYEGPIKPSEAASTTILFANISERNIRSLLTGTVFALVLISFLLIVPMRSLKFGLLSLVPNLLPAAIGFGVWGLLVGNVGLAISVVVGMTMGVVVDDTVHFMTKYLRHRRDGRMQPAQALTATFEQVGPALFGTTLILAAGFALLSLSGFEVNQQMGALTTIVILVAFFADFLLLPSLILLLDKKEKIETVKRANMADIAI
ncbi:hypothetical protein PALB_23620 [Pseudoalteromonas luteoviolacea B = ATCC 29581]|nr:hypothetical protein PALB_23620 [Pseudoalteromonas luteoviolacea B = ATCC 29581]